MMAVARTLLNLGSTERQLYLFDTFEGMTAPTDLDTDWYESTLHEMIHLFPRLQEGGVLILDDYFT